MTSKTNENKKTILRHVTKRKTINRPPVSESRIVCCMNSILLEKYILTEPIRVRSRAVIGSENADLASDVLVVVTNLRRSGNDCGRSNCSSSWDVSERFRRGFGLACGWNVFVKTCVWLMFGWDDLILIFDDEVLFFFFNFYERYQPTRIHTNEEEHENRSSARKRQRD